MWAQQGPEQDYCSALFCGPDQPSLPFSSPLLIVCDVVRVLCAACGVGVIAYSILGVVQAPIAAQKARFLALALLAVIVGGTELTHLGDYPSARLLLHIVAVLVGLFGVVSFRSEAHAPGNRRGP